MSNITLRNPYIKNKPKQLHPLPTPLPGSGRASFRIKTEPWTYICLWKENKTKQKNYIH